MQRKPLRKKNRLWRGLMFLAGAGLAVGVAGYFAVSAWIQNYLRGDACRGMLARQIGSAARAQCELEPLSWSGWNAYAAKIALESVETGSGWRRVEADGLQASLDWNAVRRGVWHVPVVELDWVRFHLADAAGGRAPAGRKDSGVVREAPAGPEAPAWVRRWLPTRTELDRVEVRRFDLRPAASGGVAVDSARLTLRPASEPGAWKVDADEGRLTVPSMTEPFRLEHAVLRGDARGMAVNDAAARWMGESEVTARGELPWGGAGGWTFSGRLSGLDLRHVLSNDWKPKLGGVIEGDYEVSGGSAAPVLSKAKVQVKNGLVQALPVLERVAEFTRTERFRRVVLDVATGDIESQGDRLRVSRLVLQSNGLARVEGELVITGQKLDGDLAVGVSPETLRWLPGAQNHVFTDARGGTVPGFVWTRVKLSGTLDSPREDLSNRLLVAMGKAVLLDAPMEVLGTGVDVLGQTGGAAVRGGKAVLDEGKDLIKGAGEAAGKGLDTLKGFIPLLPK